MLGRSPVNDRVPQWLLSQALQAPVHLGSPDVGCAVLKDGETTFLF